MSEFSFSELLIAIKRGQYETKDFNLAYGHNIGTLFTKILRSLIQEEKGFIINIFGIHKSGRSTVARAIAERMITSFNLDKEIDFSWSFTSGHSAIRSRNILIVEPGEAMKELIEREDPLAVKMYRNRVNITKSIVILITSEKLQNVDFNIETLKIIEETNEIKVMLHVEQAALGTFDVRRLGDDRDYQLFLKSQVVKTEYFKSDFQKIMDNLPHTTEQFLSELLFPVNMLFRDKKLRRRQNAIKRCFILVYGSPEAGKSTHLEILNGLFNNHYGSKHVWSIQHADDLGILLHKGFSPNHDHWCQFLSLEDATFGIEEDSEVANDWINFRHEFNEKTGGTRQDRSTGLQQGVGYTAFNLHKLEGKAFPSDYRQNFNMKSFLDTPQNRYDFNLISNELEQGIYFNFLIWVMDKKNQAYKDDNEEEYNKYLGIGVAKTASGIYPFRLHADEYKPREIQLLDEYSQWRKTFQDVIDYLKEKYSTVNYKKLPNRLIDADINHYEWERFGRIRPQTERKVNWRKVVKDDIIPWYELTHDNTPSSTEKSKSVVVVQNDEHLNYELAKIEELKDSTFIEKIIEQLENRKSLKRSPADFEKSIVCLRAYETSYRKVKNLFPELGDPAASTVSEWVSWYQMNYQGYDGEAALLKKLGAGWKSDGANSAGADLYNQEKQQLISLKTIGFKKDITQKARKVGKAELKMIQQGWDGELWIFVLGSQTWIKYTISIKEESTSTEAETEVEA